MFRHYRKLKLLVTVLGFVFLIGVSLAATHVHIHLDSKSEQGEPICPLCQLARTTTKCVVNWDIVPNVEPYVTVNTLEITDSEITIPAIVDSSSIRGPPSV